MSNQLSIKTDVNKMLIVFKVFLTFFASKNVFTGFIKGSINGREVN